RSADQTRKPRILAASRLPEERHNRPPEERRQNAPERAGDEGQDRLDDGHWLPERRSRPVVLGSSIAARRVPHTLRAVPLQLQPGPRYARALLHVAASPNEAAAVAAAGPCH